MLVPAFRVDSRCDIAVIAATDLSRAKLAASELGIARASSDWASIIEDGSLDAIAVATPPKIQPEIVLSALKHAKAVFAEKPMALSLAKAEEMTRCAAEFKRPNMVDFNFTEIASWKKARQLLQAGKLGDVRHASVHWQVENYTNRVGITNWKSSIEYGGGTLFNFVSHCMHYLEWFLGPIVGLWSKHFRIPHDERTADTTVVMCLSFQSGAAASLSVSSAAYLGSGHRVEFYGNQGTLALENSTADYMRGFKILMGTRPDTELRPLVVEDPEERLYADGRIVPTSRLACQFLDWIEKDVPARPDFSDGLRVQRLLHAALNSHETGKWVSID